MFCMEIMKEYLEEYEQVVKIGSCKFDYTDKEAKDMCLHYAKQWGKRSENIKNRLDYMK